MRVILINELYSMGGSEIQTLREIDLLRKKGHDVWLITFDKSLGYVNDPTTQHHLNLRKSAEDGGNTKIAEKLYDWFFLDRRLLKELQNIYENIKPNVIHINVINYMPITVYTSMYNYKCVQTIRDYSAVCPRALCVKKDYKACEGYLFNNCFKECFPEKGLKERVRFLLAIHRLRITNKIRRKNVDSFLCPSLCLTNVCCSNLLETSCVNDPLDFSLIKGKKKRTLGATKIYLVYGLIAEHKGIKQIIDAFLRFATGKNVELHIIGNIEKKFMREFEQLCQLPGIVYLGGKTNKEIIEYLERVYCVVVPSLWLENYPNTALEGIATRCLVIGANRGGIPEIVCDSNLLFDVLDIDSIVNTLSYVYALDEREVDRITNENYLRIAECNSLELYYERMMRVFENVTRK